MKTEQQKAWSKMLREEKKKIETILHPEPIFNGLQICHEHLRNGKIRFTAWVGETPVNMDKQVIIERSEVLRVENDFYMLYEKDLRWLAECSN
jgi:hypothetical protein